MDADTLFNLGFSHWPAFLVSFIPSVITLICIFYFSYFPAYRVHKTYLIFLFSIFAWQINDSLCRLSLSVETAASWDRLLVIAWMLIIPSGIHWALLFTNQRKLSNRSSFIFSIYFSQIFLAILLCAGVYSQTFVYTSWWGWVRTYTDFDSFLVVVILWWCLGASYIIFLFASYAYKKRNVPVVNHVSFWILIGYAVPALVGITTQIIFPLFLDTQPVPITSMLMSSIVLVITGINTNKVFSLSETLDTERITEVIQEIIFVISPERAVTYINPYGANVTGAAGTEKKSLDDIFLSVETCRAFESQIINLGFQNAEPSHSFFSKEDKGREINWDVSTYPLSFKKSVNGLLVMCRDVSDRILMGETKLAALRSQMNPHFIFNSLNSIQHYIHSNQREAAESFLSAFAVLIRQILENSSHSFIPLADELHSLQLYLKLEKVRFGNGLDCQINIDPNIDSDVLLVPSMLIQPYVENAILHGLSPMKEGAILTIQIKKEAEFIICLIKDNGIGRKKATEIKNRRKLKRTSLGMSITQARLDILNKRLNFPVEVKITDLFDMQQMPCGTLVQICIPVEERF